LADRIHLKTIDKQPQDVRADINRRPRTNDIAKRDIECTVLKQNRSGTCIARSAAIRINSDTERVRTIEGDVFKLVSLANAA
jgi:hypothetical protein